MSAFDLYFEKVYGERWVGLKRVLLEDPWLAVFENPFSDAPEVKTSGLTLWKDRIWLKPPGYHFVPERQDSGLLDFYLLDPASVIVAEQMKVQRDEHVLDMCAAPGGKSLVMFSGRLGDFELTANDLSPERRLRMNKIFDQYIPSSLRGKIQVSRWDAVQFGLQKPHSFDRILLDAPCSGERHLLAHPKEVEEWKPKRAQSLAQRQYALLCAALLAARPGGEIVYSTCSINPVENDGVIERALDRKGESFDLVDCDEPSILEDGEKTQFGWQFLPDKKGFGPIYFSKLKKKG